MLGVVDPKCTIMALHLYAGILKVVPLMLDVGEELKAFNCRLEDLCAIDMQFLHGYDRPSIAYLAEASAYVLCDFKLSNLHIILVFINLAWLFQW